MQEYPQPQNPPLSDFYSPSSPTQGWQTPQYMPPLQQQMPYTSPQQQQQMEYTPPFPPQQQPMSYAPSFPFQAQTPYAPSQQQQTPYAPPFPPQQQDAPMNASAVNVNVNVATPSSGPGLLVRALYYIFIGWWLGFFWLNLGIFLCYLVVTLPLGLMVLNRLPQVLTLRPASRTTQTNVSVATTMTTPGPYSSAPMMAQTVNVNVNTVGAQQHNLLIRALYFVCIGWWAGAMWAYIGYAFCVFIVTLPVGLMMLNRLPAVLTLRKN